MIPNRRRLASLAALALALLVAHAAAAEEVQQLFGRAKASFALGKYADAAADFERAFELKPDAAILYNAAQAHRLAGNKPRARQLYQSFVRLYSRDTQDPRDLDEAKRHIAELSAAIEAESRAASSPSTALAGEAATTTRAAPRPAPWYRRPWVWGAAGGAVVAGLVIGLSVGLTAKHDPAASLGAVTY